MIFWQRGGGTSGTNSVAQVAQTPLRETKKFNFYCETTFYFFMFHGKWANGQIIQ
jgi:hypothetical protein